MSLCEFFFLKMLFFFCEKNEFLCVIFCKEYFQLKCCIEYLPLITQLITELLNQARVVIETTSTV